MLSVEEFRAQRPREVLTARLLSIAAAVLWAPLAGYLYYPQSGLVALSLILYVFGAFGVAKGRKAGRTLAVVTLALTYVLLLPYCVLGFRDSYLNGPVYALTDICAVLLSATSLVLIYRPRSKRYFHLVTVARDHDT
ncbi:hypothetical protein [Amycolatopsis taiwanensis]|uniref:Uncharacterized protein n=1 Tax=Amycolatopsis taiwanensis TaxID=342230 RepID=A0A9W6VDU1_9PSEU|nr:hypothetical protein [Amycolatopsis taiwanensis]GLY65105.1 hypothetical protein Atai01_17240 [Amycolatopsis taiwanensis]